MKKRIHRNKGRCGDTCLPFLHVNGSNCREACRVFDLTGHWLRSLNATLCDIERNVNDRSERAAEQTDRKLPKEERPVTLKPLNMEKALEAVGTLRDPTSGEGSTAFTLW